MTEDEIETENASADDGWGEAMAEQVAATTGDSENGNNGSTYQPEQLDTGQAMPDAYVDGNQNLDLVLDIPVTLSMEIGRTRIPIRNLLQLSQGSVVELDRLAGEPMDVMVNGTLIAQGEVVVVNDKYGIRLTDIISPTERIKRLK